MSTSRRAYARKLIPERYERHWPGTLAEFLGIRFQRDQYSVYLDYEALPDGHSPFTIAAVRRVRQRQSEVNYGINDLATATYFSSGYAGALKHDGTVLEEATKLQDISPQVIIFASSDGG